MRRLSRVAGGSLLVAALGCGGSKGSTDPTAVFVGVWKGTGVTSGGSGPNSRAITLPIEEISPSSVKLHGFCGSNTDIYSDGPTASVNGNNLTLQVGSCTYTANSCGPTTLTIPGGNGVLTPGVPTTLTVSVNMNFNTCGNTSSQLVTFTSSSKQPYGTNAMAPDEAPLDEAAGALQPR